MAKDKDKNTGGVAVTREYYRWRYGGRSTGILRGYTVDDQPHIKIRQGAAALGGSWYAYDSQDAANKYPIVARARTLTALRVKPASPCGPLDDRQEALL